MTADREHVARLVEAAREQGLPERVEDPAVLRSVAVLIQAVQHDRAA